jgi:hypothetical protein
MDIKGYKTIMENKTKINYQNGKVYIIRSYLTDDVYIGSTVKSLAKRLANHNFDYKSFLNKKYYNVSSFEIIKHAYIELIENYPCDSKEQLNAREGYWIRSTPNCVNKCIAGRSDKEWRNDNKETLKQKDKQYREKNKDTIKQKKKQYREKNKDSINKKSKQYREKNKVLIKQKQNKK